MLHHPVLANKELVSLSFDQQGVHHYPLLKLRRADEPPYSKHTARFTAESFDQIHRDIACKAALRASQFFAGYTELSTAVQPHFMRVFLRQYQQGCGQAASITFINCA